MSPSRTSNSVSGSSAAGFASLFGLSSTVSVLEELVSVTVQTPGRTRQGSALRRADSKASPVRLATCLPLAVALLRVRRLDTGPRRERLPVDLRRLTVLAGGLGGLRGRALPGAAVLPGHRGGGRRRGRRRVLVQHPVLLAEREQV